MRDKLEGALKPFVTVSEYQDYKTSMAAAEDWLYNDGYDAAKQQYGRKIDELRLLGDRIEFRFNEDANRSSHVDNLRKQIDNCKSFCSTYDEAHNHITEEERSGIRSAIGEAERCIYIINLLIYIYLF